jgi:maleylpyruvate isomerase
MDRNQLDAAMAATQIGHRVLSGSVGRLSDEQVREPSLLPGWTRGHLLTHLARNADSHVRMLSAAEEGKQVEQYVGGREGRAADIEAGASRAAPDLIADFENTAEGLFALWPKISPGTWDEGVIAVHGGQPAYACVFSRLRETEIHHVDLDVGYGIDDWPAEFVSLSFPGIAGSLEERVPAGTRLEVIATDMDLSFSTGDGDLVEVVRGPARVLLAWLAGRDAPTGELESESGSLPDLGAWL